MNILILNGSPRNNGATNEIIDTLITQLSSDHAVKKACLGDYNIQYCTGCKTCYVDGHCFQEDDVQTIYELIDASDALIMVVPSYWADVPGQLKVLFDRFTPYANTNANRARTLRTGKKGFAISLRTGTNPVECENILKSIEHFYGHMEIECHGNAYYCKIEDKSDIEPHKPALAKLCTTWFANN